MLALQREYLPGRILSEEQQRQYWTEGYVIVKGVVPQKNLEDYKRYFQDICDGKVEKGNMTVMKDVSVRFDNGERAINKIQDFQYHEPLFAYCKLPQVVSIVQDIIGPNVLAVHTMLINKPPDSGAKTSRHPMHQDLHYFPFRPEDKIVCGWTAMEKVNRDNGCLVLIPRSHRQQKLLPHGYPDWEGGVNKMYHGIQNLDADKMDKVYAVMEPGDTVFFHPLLIHGSGANKTRGFRKAISCHYAAGDCHYIDVKGTSQESIADEVNDLVLKRFGSDAEITYEDIWKYRARLVSGIRSTL